MNCKNYTLNCRGRIVVIDKPQVWGILNFTSDSFYDGGRYKTIQLAMDQVAKMIEEGADVIDIGAMSSRPGAHIISPKAEIDMLSPLVAQLKREFPQALLSIDTIHSDVAEHVIDQGVDIINDISGGNYDQKMMSTIGQYDVPYVMMHMKGTPETMKSLNQYDDMVLDIMKYFKIQVTTAKEKGIKDIIIDPGFGFSKDITQNFNLLRELNTFKVLEKPLMAGVSRKSTIYKTLGVTADEALNGTTALHMVALMNGADILRVHDVKEAVECVKLYLSYMKQENT